MFAQTTSSNSGLGSSLLSADNGGALLSPYTQTHGLASPLLPCTPTSAPHSAGFRSDLDKLHLSPSLNTSDPVASANASCSILPASFSLWVQNTSNKARHVLTSLEHESMVPYARHSQTLPHKSVESVRSGHLRFPRLAAMHRRMPCQFLHCHVPLSLPRTEDAAPLYQDFHAQFSLTSAQDLPLSSVTSLYLEGKQVSCVVESLKPPRSLFHRSGVQSAGSHELGGQESNARPSTPTGDVDPRRVSNGSSLSFSPISNSSHGHASPRTPPEANTTSTSSLEHSWCYQAPFKTAFLAEFLRQDRLNDPSSSSEHVQSFTKSHAQRALLNDEIATLTIVQEFVVTGQQEKQEGSYSLPNESDDSSSPGSTVGDVVLVIAWDFECVENLANQAGTPILSLLTAVSGASPMKRVSPLPSPLLKFDLNQADSGYDTAPSAAQVQPPTLLRKRGMSMNKANLMLSIPPASMHLNPQNGPNSALLNGQPQLTPAHSPTPIAWGIMHQRAIRTPLTPLPQQGGRVFGQPPPLNSGDEARLQKERLERLWASKADAMVGPLHSPLEMNFGANATCMPPTTAATNMAAAACQRPSPNALGLTIPTSVFGSDGNLLSPAHF